MNSVQPGSHDTDRIRNLHGGDTSGAAADIPVGVLGRPEAIGVVVGFLCRDQAWSGRITGETAGTSRGEYAVLRFGGGRPGPAWGTLQVSRSLPDGGDVIHVLRTPSRQAALMMSRAATVTAFACRPVQVPVRSDVR